MQDRGHSRIRSVALLLAAATALVLVSSGQAAAAPIKLGVYTASQGQLGAPEEAAALDGYAAAVGRNPDIVMDYSNITDPLLTSREISNLAARGETPLVTWQLFESGWGGPTIPLEAIAAGDYDGYLRRAAELAKTLPFDELMIRFGHEMNGDWYGWSGSPAAYVSAWRHVVTVFRQVGAANVKWVWAPNVDNGSYPFASYFPGDAWVDYVGLDGYNWGTAGIGVDKWQSLEQVFSSSYDQLTNLSSKPVMITETSSSEVGGDKAAWITRGFLHTIPERFPRVSAVIWYDRSQEEDWRVASSQASLDAYRAVVSSTLYGGTDPAPRPEDSAPAVVKSVVVTSASAGGQTAKGHAKTVGRRSRLVYRLSQPAKVRIEVHVRRPGGARSSRVLTIDRTQRRGSLGLSRLLAGRSVRRAACTVLVRAIDDDSAAASPPRRTGFLITSL